MSCPSLRPWTALFALALLAAPAACADDSGTTSTNTASTAGAPTIANVTAKDQGNGIVLLAVKATDPQNGRLSYAWTVTKGTLASPNGQNVEWQPPKVAGTYTATVVVSNARGAKISGSQTFTVAADGTVAPTGDVQVTALSNASVNSSGQFIVPSPVGSGAAALLTPANPNAQTPNPGTPDVVILQPVATPPGLLPPAPPVLQPLATPPPTGAPASPAPSPVPPAAPTPVPITGVPVPPPLRWVQYDPSKVPTPTGNLVSLFFSKPTRGWFVGSGATVLLYNQTDPKVDPGVVSKNFLVPPGANLSHVNFVSDTNGFISGGSLVMRTVDGGESWQPINQNIPGIYGSITSLVVHNARKIDVADNTGNVFRTESADATDPTQVSWIAIRTHPGDRPADQAGTLLAGAAFPNSDTISYFVGDGVYRMDATDPVNGWKKILNLSPAASSGPGIGDGTATSIQMPTANELWVGTTSGNLLRMTDGGTWTRLGRDLYRDREFNGNNPFLPAPGGIAGMTVLDSNNAFLAGSLSVYDTTDATTSWKRTPTPTMYDLQMFNNVVDGKRDFRGWSVGVGNNIFQYRPSP